MLTLTQNKQPDAAGEETLGEESEHFKTSRREEFNFTGRHARRMLLIEKHCQSESCTAGASYATRGYTGQQHKRHRSSSSWFPLGSHWLQLCRQGPGHSWLRSPQQRSQWGVICWVVRSEQPVAPVSAFAWAHANKVSGSNRTHQQTSLPGDLRFMAAVKLSKSTWSSSSSLISPERSQWHLWPLAVTAACV